MRFSPLELVAAGLLFAGLVALWSVFGLGVILTLVALAELAFQHRSARRAGTDPAAGRVAHSGGSHDATRDRP